MEGYLGEFPPDAATEAECSARTPSDWAMLWIHLYGGIDGDHHKAWVIDQIARILLGTPVVVTVAHWSVGHRERRFRLGEPSPQYVAMVGTMHQYGWDVGVAP